MTYGGKNVKIEVGRRYIWKPNDPSARAIVRVRNIEVEEDGKTWVETVRDDVHGFGPRWNSADRFQKACVYA